MMTIGFIFIIGFLGIIINYNEKSRQKTKLQLAKDHLQQRLIPPFEAFGKMIYKTFDYKGRASLSEYWCALLIYIPLLSFLSFPKELENNIFLSLTLSIILLLPLLSLCVRRFADCGLAPRFSITIFVTQCIGIYTNAFLKEITKVNNGQMLSSLPAYIILIMLIIESAYLISLILTWRYSLTASIPYKNKYGDVPNLEKQQ